MVTQTTLPRQARSLMIQGTGSNVGKSLLVAGLCRAALRRGLAVAPFKPQNMSNNAAVTADGGEIGRAQALQALACGLDPHTDMNPVLLKPETDTGAQVVVQGRRVATVKARDYAGLKPSLLAPVLDSFHRLTARHDLVIVEGAGSPAEVNLRAGDIANMGFARAADCPVVLVGDIDRGGVIAQIVGTQVVLDAGGCARRSQVSSSTGFAAIRGLFDDGYAADRRPHRLARLRRRAVLSAGGPASGRGRARPGRQRRRTGGTRIACLAFSRIANFDDLDPLKLEAGVDLVMVRPGQPIPGDAAVVILPGSKSTRGDLAFLRAQGWDIDLRAHHRRGGHVLGLCGGYQMLGRHHRRPRGHRRSAG